MKRVRRASITHGEVSLLSVCDPRFPGKGYRLGTIEQSRAKINKSSHYDPNTNVMHVDTSLATTCIAQHNTSKA